MIWYAVRHDQLRVAPHDPSRWPTMTADIVAAALRPLRHAILISVHTIQCRTRQTKAEQYIQEEHIKYSKNTNLKTG